MAKISRLGPGDRFRALVGAQLSQDPARLDHALKTGIDAVGQPQGLPRAQIRNEYETFRMLADDPAGLKSYANQVLERAARSSGFTVAELKTSVAEAIGKGLDLAEVTPPEAMRGADEVADIDHALLGEALAELDALVGLEPLKAYVHKLVEDATWDALMGDNAKGIDDPFGDEPDKGKGALRHLRVAGNPGAGKTTAVKILGKVYKALGMLSEGHVHKVEAKDLIAKYLGQTADKTSQAFEAARGGVFFIDDVQTILPLGGPGDRYNKEALDTLLGFVFEPDTLIVTATYPDRMDEFVGYDPGFKSRFPTEVGFPDFTPDQLTEIFERLCHSQKIDFSPEALEKVDKTFRALKLSPNFGNARLVENCFEDWTQNLRQRVLASRKADAPLAGVDAKTLLPEDITRISGGDLVTLDANGLRTEADIVAALDEHVVGHAAAKEALSTAVFERMHQRAAGKGTQKPVGFHFFAGPSGVGKTELAKGLAETAYNGRLETVDCSKLTSSAAVEAFVNTRLAQLDGKSSVVLFDEVEKAHPSLFTHLLRVADEGKMMKMNGDADLSSCHFILTSNLGNTTGLFDDVDAKHPMGEYADPAKVEKGFAELFAKVLPAEFEGRLSEAPIVFRPLGMKALDLILDGTLDKLVQVQARAYDREIEVDPDLRLQLVQQGHDPRLGARPMERVVRREVLLPFLRAMVDAPDEHPPGHTLVFGKGKPEKPTIQAMPDPERIAAAEARSKADAAAEKALSRALSIETLTSLVEDEVTSPEAYAGPLHDLCEALPRDLEAFGIDRPLADWMANASDAAPYGVTQALAETLVTAMKDELPKTWPVDVALRTRELLRESELDWNDAIAVLEPMLETVGRKLPTEYAAAKAELARSLQEAAEDEDSESACFGIYDGILRAHALTTLHDERHNFYFGDGQVRAEALDQLAEGTHDHHPTAGLQTAREVGHRQAERDWTKGTIDDVTSKLARDWSGKEGRPAAETRRRDLWQAYLQSEDLDDTGLTALHWLTAALASPAGEAKAQSLDLARRRTRDRDPQWGLPTGEAREILLTAALDAVGLDDGAREAHLARADAIRSIEDWHPYEDLNLYLPSLERFAATRGRTDALGKMLRRLAKQTQKTYDANPEGARASLKLGLSIVTSFGALSTPAPADVADTVAECIRDEWANTVDRIGDEANVVRASRAWLDAVKEIFPANDKDGDWARKAGAQMAGRSDADRLATIEEAFGLTRPEE